MSSTNFKKYVNRLKQLEMMLNFSTELRDNTFGESVSEALNKYETNGDEKQLLKTIKYLNIKRNGLINILLKDNYKTNNNAAIKMRAIKFPVYRQSKKIKSAKK